MNSDMCIYLMKFLCREIGVLQCRLCLKEYHEDDETEFDLVSGEVLDSMLTISTVACKEAVLPSGAYEVTASEQPTSS